MTSGALERFSTLIRFRKKDAQTDDCDGICLHESGAILGSARIHTGTGATHADEAPFDLHREIYSGDILKL